MTRGTDLARFVGENPLAAFAVALILVLLAIGTLWLTVHRVYIRSHRLPDGAAARSMLALLVLGFSAIVVAAALLASAPQWLTANDFVASADQSLADALRRSVSPAVLRAFAAITVLANTAFLWILGGLVAASLWWRRLPLLACVWIAAFAGNGVLTPTLKTIFARARPSDPYDAFTAQGFGFPSGHSSGAVIAYGMLAYLVIRLAPTAWHLPAVLTATAIAFTVGCSRIFLRVHYPSDVLAGFASGLAWLAVCVMVGETVRIRAAGRK